ncbi:MAG: ribose-phosphate diphosphokinase [Elusimicrobiota bacterium]
MNNSMKIFTGNANPGLAKDICGYLGMEPGKALIEKFSDGECRVKILESVRGKDVFVVQSTAPPVNDNLMELLVMIDAFKRASVKRMTVVIPYFGYARQDRKDTPRVPITAKLVADMLQTAGVDRVLVMDIHSKQIQGFFDCPVDNLQFLPVLIDYVKEKKIKDLTVVAPDPGGVGRARNLAKKLKSPLVLVDKRRSGPNVSRVFHVVGKVAGRNALILDDMVDTAGTLTQVVKALKKNGAKKVYAAASHGVLSGRAPEKIRKSEMEELIITDTIKYANDNRLPKVKVLSIAELLGDAMMRIHTEKSVSDLFV